MEEAFSSRYKCKESTETAALSCEITEKVEQREPVKLLKHLARIYLLIVIQVDDDGFGRGVSIDISVSL